jgi:outer membrane protein
MKRFFLSLLIIISTSFACSSSVFAEGGEKLTLDDFISRTILNNPTVRAYVQSHQEAKGQEYASRGIDDVHFDSLFSMARKENPQITGYDSTLDKEIAYRVGLSKVVSQSGTRLSASYQNAWLKGNYPAIVTNLFNPINPLYTPSVTLSLTQPLLKNWLGAQDQLGKRLSRINLELSQVSYQENIETFISEMTDLYLKWLRSYNDSNILNDVYKKVSEQVSLVRKQVEAKVSEKSDLYRILEQQANYKALWEGAMAGFEGYSKEVAAMMAPLDPPNNISPAPVDGTFLSKYRSRTNGLAYLKERSRIRRILDYTSDNQEVRLKADKNARLPELDAFVDYSRVGAASSFGRSHGSTFNNDDVSGGLTFTVPLPDREARGNYRAQKAALARTNYENERTMLNATSQLEAFYEQEQRLAQQVKAYQEQVKYGRLKIDDEKDQYDDGRLSLFQLLQDVSTYISQSLDLETSKVNLAQVRLLIGELTDVNFDAFQPTIEDVVAVETE